MRATSSQLGTASAVMMRTPPGRREFPERGRQLSGRAGRRLGQLEELSFFSSVSPSPTPFLNSLADSPSERASFGRRAAPNSSITTRRMMSSSGAPMVYGLPVIGVPAYPRPSLHPQAGLIGGRR